LSRFHYRTVQAGYTPTDWGAQGQDLGLGTTFRMQSQKITEGIKAGEFEKIVTDRNGGKAGERR